MKARESDDASHLRFEINGAENRMIPLISDSEIAVLEIGCAPLCLRQEG